MNSDLKLRLTNYLDASARDLKFINMLIDRFIDETGNHPVDFSIKPINGDEDDTGWVVYHDEEGFTKGFTVVLDDRLQVGTIHDYLIHEFAHAGTWFVNEDDDHGPIFGVEYARLYRIYLDMYERYYS